MNPPAPQMRLAALRMPLQAAVRLEAAVAVQYAPGAGGLRAATRFTPQSLPGACLTIGDETRIIARFACVKAKLSRFTYVAAAAILSIFCRFRRDDLGRRPALRADAQSRLELTV